jgi:16S rRNA G966 N2-methylase RsmD
MIFQGENLVFLEKMEKSSVYTIYIDPPYNTKLKI